MSSNGLACSLKELAQSINMLLVIFSLARMYGCGCGCECGWLYGWFRGGYLLDLAISIGPGPCLPGTVTFNQMFAWLCWGGSRIAACFHNPLAGYTCTPCLRVTTWYGNMISSPAESCSVCHGLLRLRRKYAFRPVVEQNYYSLSALWKKLGAWFTGKLTSCGKRPGCHPFLPVVVIPGPGPRFRPAGVPSTRTKSSYHDLNSVFPRPFPCSLHGNGTEWQCNPTRTRLHASLARAAAWAAAASARRSGSQAPWLVPTLLRRPAAVVTVQARAQALLGWHHDAGVGLARRRRAGARLTQVGAEEPDSECQRRHHGVQWPFKFGANLQRRSGWLQILRQSESWQSTEFQVAGDARV